MRRDASEGDFTHTLDDLVGICPDPVIGVNQLGIIIRFNAAAERLLGYAAGEVVGRLHINDVYDPPELARQIGGLMKSAEYGPPGQIEGFEAAVRSRCGRRIDIRLSATVLHQGKQAIGSIGFFHDLTERKELEAALKRLSITDNLTGLYNQRHFHAALGSEVERATRYRRPLSLLCIDLDHFKSVNDQLGHPQGDEVLRRVGDTLGEMVRHADIAFRYGGDEFMVLLPETHAAEASAIAERIRIAFLGRWPAEWDALHPGLDRVSMSLGVAEWVSGEDASTLVKRADVAMYEAKRGGGNQSVLADERIGRLVEPRQLSVVRKRPR